jgi:hypothetical protein
VNETGGSREEAMSFTDATKLIQHDPSNPEHRDALARMKQRLEEHKQHHEQHLADVKRALKTIDQKLKQKPKKAK